MSDRPYRCSTEVAEALAHKQPVVALESTIVTHGMPWPQNLAMAREVETLVRTDGATPATIAVLDGVLHIGLEGNQLERLAETDDAMKLSRADLAFAMAEGRTGATTVAASMIAAHMAGIPVFATGGIGGVHRGAELSFDISADLEELARTPVAVVCAGAKAILDLPKTLEVLETKGVPVVTHGAAAVPAFWSRDSGLASPLRLDSADAVARILIARRDIPNSGGVLIANPIPAADEIPRDEMERHIADALAAAKQEGVTGKDVTPFLLAKIFDLTEGRSLTANIALVKNNARLAAAIAKALAQSA